MQKVNQQEKRVSVSVKVLIIAVAIIVLIIAAILIWKSLTLKQAEKKWKAETALLNELWLARMAQPYVWAIRKEIMSGNMAEVDLYGNELVRKGTFADVIVTGKDGKIVSTTNKRFQGAAFSAYAESDFINIDTATVHKLNDSVLLLASPVMGLNERIGTVVIKYPVPTKH